MDYAQGGGENSGIYEEKVENFQAYTTVQSIQSTLQFVVTRNKIL